MKRNSKFLSPKEAVSHICDNPIRKTLCLVTYDVSHSLVLFKHCNTQSHSVTL